MEPYKKKANFMPPIRSLVMTAQLRTDQFESGTKRIQGSLRDIRTTTTQVQGTISGLGSALAGMGASAAGAVLSFHALKSGIESVVQTGMRMQTLQAAFKQVAGSAEAGRKEFAFVADAANRVGQNVEVLAKGYHGLAAASKGTRLEGQATKDIFLAMTQAGRALQLNQEQLQGALLSLNQMMSKGTVQAEEIRGQLGERLPGAFQIAARAMGVTTAELGKMLEQGQVLAEDFLPKFAAQLRKELGQNTEEVTRTAAENFARFGNAMTIVADNIAKNTGLLDWLGKVADKLANIVIEGDKAAKKLDEVAKERTTKDIARATGGRGAEETAANDRRIRQIDMINRQLKEAEEAIKRLGRDFFKEPLESAEVRRRLEELAKGPILEGRFPAQSSEARRRFEADVRREERMIRDLQEEKARLEAELKPKTFEGPEAPSIDMTPIAAAEEKNRAIVKQVQDILKGLQDATGQTENWLTETERLKKEMQEVEKAIEKLQKLPGMKGSSAGFFSHRNAPANIQEAINRLSPQYGIDPRLTAAIMVRESGFNPNARGTRGEQGLMQLMEANRVKYGVTNGFDIEQSITGGLKLLRDLMRAFNGDLEKVVAAYNAGQGAVERGRIPVKTSQHYVPAVLSSYREFGGGFGGQAAVPAAAQALEALSKRRAELDRQIKESTTITKMDEEANKAVADALEGRAEGMQRLLESLKDGTKTLSEYETAQIREKLANVQGYEATKARIGTLLTEIDVRRELVAMFQREAVEQERLGEVQKRLAQEQKDREREFAQARRELDREEAERLRKREDEQEKLAKTQQEIGASTISFFEDMVDAARKGGDAWIQFAERVAQALLRMAIEKSGLEQKLGDWVQKGLGAVLKLFGATSGTPAVDLPASDVPTNLDFNAVGMASGGPVSSGRAYLVGEKGPELFLPQTSGAIVNNALTNAYTSGGNSLANAHNSTSNVYNTSASTNVMQGDRPVNVIFNISTPDTAGFQRSRAEISRSMVQAVHAAQRSA
jgi:tape measure domain-containing protein